MKNAHIRERDFLFGGKNGSFGIELGLLKFMCHYFYSTDSRLGREKFCFSYVHLHSLDLFFTDEKGGKKNRNLVFQSPLEFFRRASNH